MSYNFIEDEYEQVLINLFQNQLGFDYFYGPDYEREYDEVLLLDIFESSILKLNKEVNRKAIDEAIRKIKVIDSIDLVHSNRVFHEYLTKGIQVNYFDGENKSDIVRLVDFNDVSNNNFLIISQFTVSDLGVRRPDLIVFLNGIPIVVIELKNCAGENADTSEAYRQVRNYMIELPNLFRFNCFTVISDMINSKVGTITSDENRFSNWKSIDGTEEEKFINYQVLFLGMFEKKRLLKIIKNYIFFKQDREQEIKVIAGYHQFFAIEKAVESTIKASKKDGKGGVVWHTQGSGKSFSMLFYTNKVVERMNNPTVIIITDRNDLDDQLYNTFASSKGYLPETPVKISSRDDLVSQLKQRVVGGIIFTTMQKFEESTGLLSERKNIVIIADEAHRSQYGLKGKFNSQTNEIKYGMAYHVRNAFPNATYIGFTGTPIDSQDKSTVEVFGDYIDIYDMTQAVEDGATRPIYYESRVVNLKLNENILNDIDAKYNEMSEVANEYDIEESKRKFASLDGLLGSEDTITSLCEDIIEHYNTRKHVVAGKAMIVAYSRQSAIKIYRKIIELDKSFEEKTVVVTSITGKEPEDWKPILGVKSDIKEKERAFKNVNSEVKIAIVVDMWLTGFDIPCLDTMYIFKPLSGHNLMQTIARVNRVYKDKEGGLIVDYIGIAKALKHAMKDYSPRDKKGIEDKDIANSAYLEFQRRLGYCKAYFNNFDYTGFFGDIGINRANAITGGINYILRDEEEKNQFIKEAMSLNKASGLCLSMLTHEERVNLAYFDAIKASLRKVETKGKLDLKAINATIEALLQQSVESDGILNIFDEGKEFSIFDEEYVNAIKNMKEKNIAAELLRKLIEDQVKVFTRTNVVKSELFSERMQKILNAYRNGQLTNIEVIEELQNISSEIIKHKDEDNNLGLTVEERAFYDAITKEKNIEDFYENDQLVEMTKELTEMINKSKTIDWTRKEQSRAQMRKMVKRLLKKYKYPPEDREKAIDIVLKQAGLVADTL